MCARSCACAITRGIDGQIELRADRCQRLAAGLRRDQSAVEGARAGHRRWCRAVRQPGDLRVPRQRRRRAADVPGTWRRALAGAEAAGDGRRHSGCVGAAPRRDDEAAGERRATRGSRARRRRWTARWTRWRPIRRIARSTSARSPIGCALGYLDFRFAAQPWRPAHPKLAAWYEAFAQNPGIANTVPKDPG